MIVTGMEAAVDPLKGMSDAGAVAHDLSRLERAGPVGVAVSAITYSIDLC
jgi:hypothetical protein